MTIKVLRETVIKQLASIKDDNVSIAGIAIERRKLLEVLKLQKQPSADMLTIEYGNTSWHYDYANKSDGSWVEDPFTLEPTASIQISCDHTVMRFFNCPKHKGYGEPAITPLNFVDHAEYKKPKLTGITLDTQELIKALTFALTCVARDETSPPLACILFDSGDNVLKLVSADGFRMAIAPITAEDIPSHKFLIHSGDISKLLVFLKAIKPVGAGKGKCYPEVYLKYSKGSIKFSHDAGTLVLNRQSLTFPNYEMLIPKDGAKIEFIADDMLRAAKSLANICNNGSSIIRLYFQQGDPAGKILFSANSNEYGESTAECDALVESDCKIAVNVNYLIDMLRLCKDIKMSVKITNSSSPMLFEMPDNWRQVTMPMFVQW